MPFSAAAWSSTELTLVPLPDAPWNTTVPPWTLSSLPDAQWNATVRPKFALGKLSQPKCCHHNIKLFSKEHQSPSNQIQLERTIGTSRALPGDPFAWCWGRWWKKVI
ncbi:unnamed protein product [Sphagnum troendelagicum]|uniref:Uncharacterized protein n=1 Tax=Sphagnum troendelagicum TaxID=128251 RepID=A0ABP0UEQ7_9BRYO